MIERSDRPRIIVAGGGPAALEALLTLGERLATDERQLCLIAPNEAFTFRPLSVVSEFATHRPHTLPLSELASSTSATFVRDRVVLVDDKRGRLLTHEGDWIGFDLLLLAVGTDEVPVPHGWLRWPAGGDPGMLRELSVGLEDRRLKSLAVFIPARAAWPLAGYELALILAASARVKGAARISLLTEEQRPLEPLGAEVENIVQEELRRAGLDVIGGVPLRHGVPEPPLSFDRLIWLPASHGPSVGGVATDGRGFIVVDEHCRVYGSERIWAAGDCTQLPLKHSMLAVTQADAAADALAAAAGAAVERSAFEPTLTGVLVHGAAERWFAENTGLPEGIDPAVHCLWWPPGMVLGGRLAHYVAHRDKSARPLLVSHPHGTALEIRLPSPSPPSMGSPGAGLPDFASRGDADEHALRIDAHDRNLFALHRLEREAEQQLTHLEGDLEQEVARSREVLSRLNAAGYLVKE